MKMELSTSQVYKALSSLIHPEIENRNLVDLGMITSVEVENNRVKVGLALPTLDVSIRNDLIEGVKGAVENIEVGLVAEVEVLEMNPDQRAAFMAIVREEQNRPRVSRRIGNVVAVMSGKGGVGKSSVAVLLVGFKSDVDELTVALFVSTVPSGTSPLTVTVTSSLVVSSPSSAVSRST